jgi:SAM-dependent methyltransferase
MTGSMPSVYTIVQYITDLRAIRSTGSATAETSFYPPLSQLLNASGEKLQPSILFSTQLRNQGAGAPDGGFFPKASRRTRRGNPEPEVLQNPERGVVEIKPAETNLDVLTNNEQIRRYLEQYGLVLITNLREFRLLKLEVGIVHVLERYVLANSATVLWSAPLTSFTKHIELLPDFLARVMLYKAPLIQPKDVAWVLASYAREARARTEDHPLKSFETVKRALTESLGIKFEGEKGEHFFRSTLVQTLFYGIFSAWILWRRSPESRTAGARFDWRVSAHYLRVPVLRKLFGEVSDPGALNSIQLQEVLNLAGEALNRVQPGFFAIFQEEEAVSYFYEPFLEAFDPQLRKELGVWYTPKEIVQYMVERVDHLLRAELEQPLGLASPNVRILDPCCGTGAYLTAVLQRIHRTLLENAGDDTALVPNELRTAALTRVFGFEIMPAPFVISHLQIASLLEDAHAPLADTQRAGIYLTNALTGWVPERHPQSVIFEEFRREREDSENIKQHGTILVILGNPPYNGYAGIAKIEEERDLTTAYREPVEGLPAPQGQGLNDLYIRFFRIAERRIAQNEGGQGIVCFISNNAWLDGLSHPTMRHHYLHTFQHLLIDNLNGDKYRTGKTTPEGLPDPSAFSTSQNREGIQLGTAISTLVRNRIAAPGIGTLELRDLWGTRKLEQLAEESRRQHELRYRSVVPVPALGDLC